MLLENVFWGEHSNKKCHYLAKDHLGALELEKSCRSEHSPGIVDDQENIVRQVFSPIHIEESGKIKSAAFDDVLNKGLSVNRLTHTTKDTIHGLGETKAGSDRQLGKKREYQGYIQARVWHIRAGKVNTLRAFAIYDTAMENCIHHADVCAILLGTENTENSELLSKKVANMSRRKKLQKIFSDLITP